MPINPWVDSLFVAIRKDILHTGSRVICDPPVMTTDDDYVILLDKDHLEHCCDYLLDEGFELGGSIQDMKEHPYEDSVLIDSECFRSYKKSFEEYGVVNIILTVSPEFFMNFRLATALAKKLNLTSKADRVTLFEAVRNDHWPLEILND